MTKVYDTATDLITFTRGSSGTALRRVGYGAELVVDGSGNWVGDFDVAADVSEWNADHTSSIALDNGTLQLTVTAAGPTFADVTRDITTVSGKLYQVTGSLTARSATKDFLVQVGGVTRQTISSNTGNIDFVFVASGTTTEIKLGMQAATSGDTFNIDNISVREVFFDRATDPLVLFNHPDDTPRIEYGSDGSLKGLLIEEQRTNLVTHSEDLNLSFASQTGVSIEPAVATQGPILTSQRMVADTSTGFHRAAGTLPVQNSTDYTFSCFFKADGQDVCGLGVYTGTTFVARASFDLSTVQETVSNGSATIKSVGGGWYHCAVTGTTTGASATVYIYVNSLFSATGDDTSGVFVYGAQLEAGSFATSYIPTSGSQSTRSADVASIPVSAFGYNDQAGTIVVEFDVSGVGNLGTNGIFEISPASGSSGFEVRRTSGGTLQSFDDDGIISSLVSNTIGQTQVIATSFEEGTSNGGYSTDGGAVTGHGTTVDFAGVAKLQIGAHDNAPDRSLNGHIKSIQYYPRRLTDAQLQELTS